MVDAREAEAELIERLRAGDERAYRSLYRDHSGDVFRLARRFVYSDAEAEEVVQEVFISAFRYLDRFRGQSRLKTWLYRVTVNRALKRKRWWTRRREVGADGLDLRASRGPLPDTLASDRQAIAVLQTLLDTIEIRKRTVLILHELEGMDTKQIAEVLGCPRSTVLTRLARARAELVKRATSAGIAPDQEGR